MIARVRGDHQALGADAFRVAGGDGEHDAVAERDDGLLHRLFRVMALRDVAAGLEKVGFEQAVHEIERDHLMENAGPISVEFRKRNLARVVLRAVVEGQASGHLVRAEHLVKRGDRIHPAAQQHADFHRGVSG